MTKSHTNKYPKVVAVDFDGTIVTHEYPQIGKPVPHALETLKWLQENDVQIILWTMRSEGHLRDATEYLKANGIELHGVNKNPDQGSWTSSPKAYAQFYIDDAAVGCPLIPVAHARPMVNWQVVRGMLEPWIDGTVA